MGTSRGLTVRSLARLPLWPVVLWKGLERVPGPPPPTAWLRGHAGCGCPAVRPASLPPDPPPPAAAQQITTAPRCWACETHIAAPPPPQQITTAPPCWA